MSIDECYRARIVHRRVPQSKDCLDKANVVLKRVPQSKDCPTEQGLSIDEFHRTRIVRQNKDCASTSSTEQGLSDKTRVVLKQVPQSKDCPTEQGLSSDECPRRRTFLAGYGTGHSIHTVNNCVKAQNRPTQQGLHRNDPVRYS